MSLGLWLVSKEPAIFFKEHSQLNIKKMSKEQLLNNNLCHEMNLKQGMIIKFINENDNRLWILLNVTQKRSLNINTDVYGLNAFGGLWYGRNPLKIKSYGKIRQLYHYSSKEIEIIRSNILNLSINKLKDIL